MNDIVILTTYGKSTDASVIPVENAQPFANALPNCQLQIYLTGGHSAAPKNAQAFIPIATKFLQK